MRIGLDIGSTTIKVAVLDEGNKLRYKRYGRHYSQVAEHSRQMLEEVLRRFPGQEEAYLAVSGSAGMGLSERCGLPFLQEVMATRLCIQRHAPDTDVAIELGGEDAKILFLSGLPDARMNGTCAGGTGAFIDQMATLLGRTLEELNTLAKSATHVHAIASRCGVFAKSDIQPLLNQGARESDVAASVFRAVVNQTIAGLAQGRPIAGKVLYLGGPLHFLSELRRSFDVVLNLTGVCPENSLYYAALGAALGASEVLPLGTVRERLLSGEPGGGFASMPPLFDGEAQYRAFQARHAQRGTPRADLALAAADGVFLGVDAGSTTVKCAVIDREGALLDVMYAANSGNPVPLVRRYLLGLYRRHPGLRVLRGAATGYGEKLIQHAFGVDEGVVETVAHMIAAKAMDPDVDFVLDIGGQDIKCMRLRNGVIDNIYLNEACSSGCGSFLQTFAQALGEDIETFARKGLLADRPVDLGSRCTVFMNSSVKQAQKDGASLENISAGLSVSVVKNALYKVIRPSGPKDLGRRIVVQGGTFLNDAVLRAFEQELGLEVTRPDIAGLMGAYGAAAFARERYRQGPKPSTLFGPEALEAFEHRVTSAVCGRCANQCRLTVNRFGDGRTYISGNRCGRLDGEGEAKALPNAYQEKRDRLSRYVGKPGRRGRIGLPLGLNLYELVPFWHGLFTALGFEVVISPPSDRALYLMGQSTIPSDTVCYPAKLMHGHVQWLIDRGVETIFYPCMSYNVNDGLGDNCYNCPVVAYYPEVLRANMQSLSGTRFLNCYVGLHRPRYVAGRLWRNLAPHFPDLTPKEMRRAVAAGYAANAAYREDVRRDGERIIREARERGLPIVVLAGRPYHIDPEINHGIDRLIGSLGAAVVGEDAVSSRMKGRMEPLRVLNQWTYHSRLYAAAQYASTQQDMAFVQLVSFGCGCDAITGDECRRILEAAGHIYTQIKIDEIENLGAANIRLRSLFAALDPEKGGRRHA